MEVGAVKQAFNNEVILLKKKLNQAKIQIIHKLTRKAKQLVEKKVPDPLKEKLKRKAQAAVDEVLLMKKIKPKDIAKFIVTHKGELKDFLNKPTVDNEKACARLLLHKALQEKYKFIRDRFANVPIKDLFMSRIERRKIKKEAKEQANKKKKDKDSKTVNSAGDWDVEDVGKTEFSKETNDDNELSGDDDKDDDDDPHELSDGDDDKKGDSDDDNEKINGMDAESNDLPSDEEVNYSEEDANQLSSNDEDENDDEESNATKSADEYFQDAEKVTSQNKSEPKTEKSLEKLQNEEIVIEETSNIKPKKVNKKTHERKQKDIEKNKHFNEKMQKKKIKKDAEPATANKIVDPFFITATGENYMSVVEPRGPDEVKAEHKYGNRKLRRAAMFGHVLNTRPRNNNSNNYRNNSDNNGNRFNNRQGDNNKKPFNNNFNDNKRGNDKFNNNFSDGKRFGDRFSNRQEDFNGKPFRNNFNDKKEEKLHPSWEAKKKKSGILPFEGKKIVFDDDT